MNNFVHDIPTRVLFGKGQIENLNDVLSVYGKKVLLVYGGGSIKKIGLYDKVMEILNGNDYTVVDCGGVEPNPRIETVAKGAELCKENDIEVVLAVGGGSTIDCAKAICVGAFFEGEDYWDMVINPVRNAKALPLVDILTLSATGSEFDNGGVISNLKTNDKKGVGFTFPSVSICDPEYTFSVNAYQTSAGSADIMSHVLEGYFSRKESDISDGIAEAILKTVINNLPKALENPEDYDARANLMWASSLACSGMPEYGKEFTGWSCHAMEHQLSAYYDITHGVGLAILTPRWMRYILEKDPTTLPHFIKFAKNVWGLDGEGEELAHRGIDALERFFIDNGIPMTLDEVGINEEKFEEMAIKSNTNDRLTNAYVPLDKEDVLNIFRMCLKSE